MVFLILVQFLRFQNQFVMELPGNAVTMVNDFVEANADPYVRGWLLMDSFFPVFIIVFLYITAVAIGPRLMATREAFSLRRVLILYNLIVTLLSLYMTVEYFVVAKSSPNYSLSCFPVDRNGDSYGTRLRMVSWLYFFSKIIELADTIFFIMRKKQNQVSFLHVYHHTNLVAFSWCGVKFVPTGETYFLAMFNSGIHVIMYFYYMMAAMGPQFQKYLWWKRYLTQLQLIQFVTILAHYVYIIIFNPKCDFPRRVLIAYSINSISFFVLFMHFYRLAYSTSQKQHAIQQPDSARKTAEFSKANNGFFATAKTEDIMKASPRKED